MHMCVWLGCELSAEQQPTVLSSSLHLVQRLCKVAQAHGGRKEDQQRGRGGAEEKGMMWGPDGQAL